jgi:hypothetical protein
MLLARAAARSGPPAAAGFLIDFVLLLENISL